MILEDSRILIDDSRGLLKEIETICSKDIVTGESSPLLRVRIKQFLDNINACLDYIAFEVFTRCCADYIKQENPEKLKFREGRVYFPCLDKKSKFDNYIHDRFPKLKEENPNVISIFEKYQPFPSRPQWLSHLKELVNSNKHRKLSRQRGQQTVGINHLHVNNGTSIHGVTLISDVGTTPLEISGEGTTITSFDGDIRVEFMFSEIDKSVLPTLKRMLRSIPTLIEEIEKELKGS